MKHRLISLSMWLLTWPTQKPLIKQLTYPPVSIFPSNPPKLTYPPVASSHLFCCQAGSFCNPAQNNAIRVTDFWGWRVKIATDVRVHVHTTPYVWSMTHLMSLITTLLPLKPGRDPLKFMFDHTRRPSSTFTSFCSRIRKRQLQSVRLKAGIKPQL